MTSFISCIADLTGHRNGDLLDVGLSQSILELLQPQSVSIFAVVDDAGTQRWMRKVHAQPNASPVVLDPLWTVLADLPALDTCAKRRKALESASVMAHPHPTQADLQTTYFPMTRQGDCHGVIEVVSRGAISAADQALINGMQVVYRNMGTLLDYSQVDTLTGLLNRKSFDDIFFKALRADAPANPALGVPGNRRHLAGPDETYWLAMLDIDHFKRVNDVHGHLIGDEVLLLVGRILGNAFRFQDKVFRFGGEEFVVLMRCADECVATETFERFRQQIQSHTFPQAGQITVSIGFTELKADDATNTALDRADQAVYFSKKNGRNQVNAHEALTRNGFLQEDCKVGEVDLF